MILFLKDSRYPMKVLGQPSPDPIFCAGQALLTYNTVALVTIWILHTVFSHFVSANTFIYLSRNIRSSLETKNQKRLRLKHISSSLPCSRRKSRTVHQEVPYQQYFISDNKTFDISLSEGIWLLWMKTCPLKNLQQKGARELKGGWYVHTGAQSEE